MTTMPLLDECADAVNGSLRLAFPWLDAQRKRYGCAETAVQVLTRRRDRCPDATHFRVERGPNGTLGRLTLFAPTSRPRQYVFGEPLPSGMTVRYGRARSGARVALFVVGGTEYRKFDRACSAATGERA